MRSIRRVLRSKLGPCLWALAWAWAFAGPASRPATAEERFAHGDYDVVRWTTNDGLPGNVVRALAQTPDGYLWIGAWGGLARFDGVRFEVFDPVSTPELEGTDVNALAVDPEGTLWIGTFDGIIATYRAGRFRTVRARPDKRAELRAIAVDAKGAVWFGGRRLVRYEGGDFHEVSDLGVRGLRADPSGDLWVANWRGVHRVRDGRVVQSDPTIRPAYGFSQEPDETFLAHGTSRLGRYPRGEVVATKPAPRLGTWQLWGSALDRDAGRWWAIQSGLYRLEPPSEGNASIEWSRIHRVLPIEVTGAARTVIEAHDGSIWVGTEGRGLLRLTPRRARPLAVPRASSVVPLADGSAWVAVIGTPRVVRVRGDEILEEHTGMRHPYVSPARGGGIWIAHDEGFARLRDGVLERFERPAGRTAPLEPIYEDRIGRLWWFDGKGGVGIENGRVVQTVEGRIWGEDRDRLLVGRTRGKDSWGWVGPAGVETHPDLSRMPTSGWRCLFPDSDGRVWVAHAGAGLSCFHENGMAVLTTAHGLPTNLLGSIVEDDQRRLWVNSNRGVFVAALDDLMAVVEGERRDAPCTLVSRQEMSYRRSAWEAGRLYASTLEGYVAIDTRDLDAEPVRLTPHIQEVSVGDRRLTAGRRVELAVGERSVRLRYTAPALSDGEFLRFQHRIDGIDRDWVEHERERTASYANLAPGVYTFRVRARGSRGDWSEPAAVTLVLPPRIDETLWFRGLLAALLVGGSVWVYRIVSRSRRRRRRALEAESERERAEEVARRLGRRLSNAQEEERSRIALELHDDISQRLAVLVLRLGTRPDDVEENQQLGQDIAGDVHRISHALHPSRLQESGLVSALHALARETQEAGEFDVEVTSRQSVEEISPESALTLYRIGQEALNNAVRHGKPGKVAVSIGTDGPDVLLEIEDDGAGFDPDQVGRIGLGLAGMAERARALGGTLSITSTPGEGTRILARVPRLESES